MNKPRVSEMNKGLVFSAVSILIISVFAVSSFPVYAWSYGRPGVADDTQFEQFGPRADRLLIKLYPSKVSEWETGLEAAQIDITDSPLDLASYSRYTTAPLNETVKTLSYGQEFNLFLFDLNNNGNQYLGNPPNPAYPNPVYPNPVSDVDLRKAVAHLSNKPKYVANIGSAFATVAHTVVGPSYGKYCHPDIKPGGAREDLCYLYNQTAANVTLDNGGFPVGPDGWRYWDRNSNHVKDAGEDFTLKFVSRVDIPERDYAAQDLRDGLTKAGVHVDFRPMASGAARTQVMANDNFHIYTGGWRLGEDPDFLILWNWDFYWGVGNSYNHCGCNDPGFNDASYGVLYANDQAEAVLQAHLAQVAFGEKALSVPLWSSTGHMAMSRTYVGTPGLADSEDLYEGSYWNGTVDVPAHGIDNYFSFLNMHPEGHEFGRDGNNMTIRHGFATQEIRSLNPLYADGDWDNTVPGLIGYESLLVRNPYDLSRFLPWAAAKYRIGTYNHPTYGTCSKAVFTLRPGVQWSDGTPLTAADVAFTFCELSKLLYSRGIPPVWWYSNVMDVLALSVLDPMNFEVLLDVKSIFSVGWVGLNCILPKHIWKPICLTGDPTTFAPDPNLVASGPWRLLEYVENSHIWLTSNAPTKTVHNNLAGSTAVTSDKGYFRYFPVQIEMQASSDYRIAFPQTGNITSFNVTICNLRQAPIMNVNCTIRVKDPSGVETLYVFGPFAVPAAGAYAVTVPVNFTYAVWETYVTGWWLSPKFSVPETDYMTVSYCTINEDAAGSTYYGDIGYGTYPYRNELPSPDIKVDIKDIARVSAGFGSYPGHSRWYMWADRNGDYKIDIKDLALLSAKFGWHGQMTHGSITIEVSGAYP